MKEFLPKMIGKKMDIMCAGAGGVRGEIVEVSDGVLHLKDDEDRISYICIEKIAMCWEVRDRENRTGFVLKPKNI